MITDPKVWFDMSPEEQRFWAWVETWYPKTPIYLLIREKVSDMIRATNLVDSVLRKNCLETNVSAGIEKDGSWGWVMFEGEGLSIGLSFSEFAKAVSLADSLDIDVTVNKKARFTLGFKVGKFIGESGS